MKGLHSLQPERVVKAFERCGWRVTRQKGSHIILVKEDYPYNLSIPVHKGKPIKQGLMKKLIELSGLSTEEFLKLYK